MRASQFVSEMIVRHKSDSPDWVIAFKDSIWLLDEEDLDSSYSDEDGNVPQQELKDQIMRVIGGGEDDSIDGYEFIENIRDTRPDVFIATIDMDNKELNVDLRGEVSTLHPKTSHLVKKLVKQLGIQRINGEVMRGMAGSEDEITYYPSEMKGRMPKYGFHGTTMSRLAKMMKTGIMPQDSGNWSDQGIHTPNTIFFAVDHNISEFHAERTSDKLADIPVVIRFKIPDVNKIIPDYDVARTLYGEGVDITQFTGSNPEKMMNKDWKEVIMKMKRPEKLFGQFGVFGYKGRIPANHFIEFYTTLEPFEFTEYGGQDYYGADKQQMIEYLKIYNEFGYDIMNPNIHGYTYDDVVAEFEDEEE